MTQDLLRFHVATPLIQLLVNLLLIAPLLLSACAPLGQQQPSSPTTQGAFDIAHSKKAEFDQETRKTAKSLHHFLIGQLLYSEKNFEGAFENFKTASELSEQDLPIINYKLAELYLKKGELDLAIDEGKRALNAEPNNLEVALLYAGLLEARGRDQESLPVYQNLVAVHPGLSEPTALLLHNLIRLNRYAEAVDAAQAALVYQPDGVLVLQLLGRASESAGLYAQAESNYKRAQDVDRAKSGYLLDRLRVAIKANDSTRAIELAREIRDFSVKNAGSDEDTSALRQLAELVLEREDYSQALKQLEAYGSGDGELVTLRMRIGLAYSQLQRQREAIRQFRLILVIDPQNHSARYLLASSLASMGNSKEAVTHLEMIPEDSEIYLQSRTLAALIFRQDNDLVGAERVLRDALSEDPENQLLISYLIMVLRESYRYNEAEQLIKATLEKNSDNDRLWFVLGQILYDQGKVEESIDAMERVLQLDPNNPEALNFVAYGLSEREDRAPTPEELTRAYELVNKAIERKPQDGYFLDTLGWILYKKGNYARSADVLERAVALTGTDFVVLEHFGDALYKLGRTARAREVYRLLLDAMRIEKWREKKESEIKKRENEKIEQRTREKLETIGS